MKELLTEIADEVDRIAKNVISQGSPGEDLGMGADGTPTKLIDEAAESACIQILNDRKENLNVLSEEIGFIDNNAEYTLVMDPIDGTHNAIRRIPFYSVSLAIGKKRLSDVKYGLVKNLASGDTFWAEKGKGAYLNDKPLKARSFDPKDSLFSIYVGRRATPRTYNVAMPFGNRFFRCLLSQLHPFKICNACCGHCRKHLDFKRSRRGSF
jgi:NAD+ kinase